MILIQSLILAVIQGISEWLPISSSGHLVVASKLLGIQSSVAFDAALHFGTLMAVFVYFGKDIMNIIEDVLKWRKQSQNFKMGLLILVSAIPAVTIGYVFEKYFEVAFSSVGLVALGFGISGIWLLIGSLNLRIRKKEGDKMGYWDSFLIGISQAAAIFPGISRSGATISAGILRGLNEKDAVKFSFLMAIPVVFGANIVAVGNQQIPSEMIWATLVAFIVGLAAIHFLIKIFLTDKKNLKWFGIYCLLMALAVGIYSVL